MFKHLSGLLLCLFALTSFIGVSTVKSEELEGMPEHLKSVDSDSVDWRAKDDTYWQSVLTPEQYAVCRERGTERPFTGAYYKSKEDGVYRCSACGQELFSSKTKFDSGTGWPSFSDVVNNKAVTLVDDNSHLMHRVEVRCSRCGAHLGHVFDDGPGPTGKRYCINSVCLFRDRPAE